MYPGSTVNNEEELAVFLIRKDESAFNYLYKKYAPLLYGVINRILADQHSSEQVLQEAFINIWGRIGQYYPANGGMCTWMINIARNAAIDVLRNKGDMRDKTRSEESTSGMSVNAHQTETIGIRSLVAKLPAEYAVILEMAYYKGCTTSEIANTLSLPEETIKTRLREGIKILRKNFQDIKVAAESTPS